MTTTENRKEISRFIQEISESLGKVETAVYGLSEAFEAAGLDDLSGDLVEGLEAVLDAWNMHCSSAIEDALDAIDEEEGQP